MKPLYLIVIIFFYNTIFAQNPLFIPPKLEGTNFNLTVQNGVTQFYIGINTNTYGINGALLAPTLVMNKGDVVTINVTNNLTGTGNSTTMHWHGMHIPAQMDGGPHQIINQGTTWRPSFKVMNDAGTFWYHPHGNNKTDLHVAKGLAGMIIVKDNLESSLNLPRTYGVDDIPVIIQTKAFDVLHQIAIATEMDTAVLTNGTYKAYHNTPAQIVRLRVLNGSSMRTYNLGLSTNQSFKMIASDAGLLDSAITLTRILLSPGERVELLVDLHSNNIGDTVQLKNYSSEMPNGIYGAKTVTGMGGATIPDYDLNPLNGLNYSILNMIVSAKTSNAVLSFPTNLVQNTPWTSAMVNTSKNFMIAPETMGMSYMVEGPFRIDGVKFNMDSINRVCYLNDVEKWRWTNQTGIAHPIHIHDMHFFISNINGGSVPNYLKGKKDVVLIMPNQYVEFITKFEDFANDTIPYMYHCHLLHHEDDGMMGSFVVKNSRAAINQISESSDINIFPNPSFSFWHIDSKDLILGYTISNVLGQVLIFENHIQSNSIDISNLSMKSGQYYINIQTNKGSFSNKLIKH